MIRRAVAHLALRLLEALKLRAYPARLGECPECGYAVFEHERYLKVHGLYFHEDPCAGYHVRP